MSGIIKVHNHPIGTICEFGVDVIISFKGFKSLWILGGVCVFPIGVVINILVIPSIAVKLSTPNPKSKVHAH